MGVNSHHNYIGIIKPQQIILHDTTKKPHSSLTNTAFKHVWSSPNFVNQLARAIQPQKKHIHSGWSLSTNWGAFTSQPASQHTEIQQNTSAEAPRQCCWLGRGGGFSPNLNSDDCCLWRRWRRKQVSHLLLLSCVCETLWFGGGEWERRGGTNWPPLIQSPHGLGCPFYFLMWRGRFVRALAMEDNCPEQIHMCACFWWH